MKTQSAETGEQNGNGCQPSPAAHGSVLSRDEWLSRCAAHFVKRAAFDAALAMEYAQAQLESLKGDLTENPEDAAEDEMSYWTPD
jgi:hypothetical protein